MIFNTEKEFEDALVEILHASAGWDENVFEYKTEQDLIDNWKEILFQNNRSVDRLNDCPLTDTEMRQIINQIDGKTPVEINSFINGKSTSIVRDNPDDTLHFGKEVSLKIYDRNEIANGKSVYQIARQTEFLTPDPMTPDRQGDVTLLINGMPLIHIELKKSDVPVSEAYYQIQKYIFERVFHGLFSLVQVFIAMNPEETVYFAHPGSAEEFNQDYLFHWENFDNEIISDWSEIAKTLLSIPMAHQLIGFYTVADAEDNKLKVMRSYQYFAANSIANKVAKTDWESNDIHGGYIWHTTGAGKTLTSFKAAQLIAASGDADKVVFLLDRIELGTQTFKAFVGFAGELIEIQATDNTDALKSKLNSDQLKDMLIVTSIQKMSRITQKEVPSLDKKRLVIVIDEAHRDVYGEMLLNIHDAFPRALYFGFTGTPIFEENAKDGMSTASIFGDELHRYTVGDGVRDHNVLGFDITSMSTFTDNDIRTKVALRRADASSVEEALSDPGKNKIFQEFMDGKKTPMAGHFDPIKRKYIRGIEDYIPSVQYDCDEHRNAVIDDILSNWLILSRNNKYHALFACKTIPEAMKYYRAFKTRPDNVNVAVLVDPSLNGVGAVDKEKAMIETLHDYNQKYGTNFTITTYGNYKKDVSDRIAHKSAYSKRGVKSIENHPEEAINILIVVDQMLTGFDSKWLNTLYIDKILKEEAVIQAFSRTNRINGLDKPHGIIRYYRKPHTMERNIDIAVKRYSGDRPRAMFANKLYENLSTMNIEYKQMKMVFENEGIQNFDRLPSSVEALKMFAKSFKKFTEKLRAAELQRFRWDKLTYKLDEGEITLEIDEQTYLVLLQRYKEIPRETGDGPESVAFDIDTRITQGDSTIIDYDYIDSHFDKWLKLVPLGEEEQEAINKALDELHSTFALLPAEDQKYAELFLADVQSGDVEVIPEKTFMDYLTEYKSNAEKTIADSIANAIGVDKDRLSAMKGLNLTEASLNEYGRFDTLKATVDVAKAKEIFEKVQGKTLSNMSVNMLIDKMLRDYLTKDSFDIEEYIGEVQ